MTTPMEDAYREGLEDGREGRYNENSFNGPTDDELWQQSNAKLDSDEARDEDEDDA